MAQLENHSWIPAFSATPKDRIPRRASGCQATQRSSLEEFSPAAIAGVIGQLLRANVQSLHLAKDLMAAQEAAGARAMNAALAVDVAAASEADAEAIDAAVDAVGSADAANRHEAELSNLWSMHRIEVYELVAQAVELLGSMSELAG